MDKLSEQIQKHTPYWQDKLIENCPLADISLKDFSYSDYSPLFRPIAFSPLILLSLGLDFGYIETEIYFTGSTFFYRSFQALPVIGFYFRWNIDDENAIAADVNLSPADYLGRFDVSSINARVMYIYTF